MQTLKALFFDFLNLLTSGSSESDSGVKQASLNEDAVTPCPCGQNELAQQTGVIQNDSVISNCEQVCVHHFESHPGQTEKAVQLRSLTLPASHPGHRVLLNSGLVDAALEQCAQARPLYTLTLAIREKILGADHPDVDESLHNLGKFFFDKAMYSRAEPVFKRSLAIRERVLGPSHLGVAESLRYLGMLYLNKGLYSLAEPPFQRSLAIREQVLGPDHPDVAESLGKLAAVFAATGRYDQAVLLYSRSLAIYEKSIDLNRPLWQLTCENLALLRGFPGQNA